MLSIANVIDQYYRNITSKMQFECEISAIYILSEF